MKVESDYAQKLTKWTRNLVADFRNQERLCVEPDDRALFKRLADELENMLERSQAECSDSNKPG